MHCLNLIISTGLLAASAVQAAPRAVPFAASAANQDGENPASEILPRAREGAALSVRAEEPSACLAPVAVVTTTTVDVTVYVTPSPAPSSPTTSTVSFVPEPVTTPASSETEAALPSCDEGSTFSFFATTTTAAPVPASDDDCVIDTAVRPVSTSTMTATVPSSAAQPTETQCVHDEPTGAPSESTRYCGIHGTSTDSYFIAAFAENRPGEPVTSEGCYQFCNSALESTEGCQSYRVYENEDGVPSCSLYGGDVAVAVVNLDTNHPDTWYDLACGSPAAEEWHDNTSADHGKRNIEAHR